MLKIEEKKERPVGKPRKVSNQFADSADKLVDYSSSEEDDKVEKVKAKEIMLSGGKRSRWLLLKPPIDDSTGVVKDKN